MAIKIDGAGFFWDAHDKTLQRKRDKLTEHKWIEVTAGYWVNPNMGDAADDELSELSAGDILNGIGASDDSILDCILPLDLAYLQVKGLKAKKEPPYPFWLQPDYLPDIEEARLFVFPEMSDQELFDLGQRHRLGLERAVFSWDIECYPNYFLIAFRHIESQKIVTFELDTEYRNFNHEKLKFVLENFTIIGFNTERYDMPIAVLALEGASNAALRTATAEIIEEEIFWKEVLKRRKVFKTYQGLEPYLDSIDIMPVAPDRQSLKIFAGRSGTRRMQDLPFAPDAILNEEQKMLVKWYCILDLEKTEDLRAQLDEQMALRVEMSKEYGIDLRSKSDAQIAEAVIGHELETLTGRKVEKPQFEAGSWFRYNVPPFLENAFQTPLMKAVLETVRNEPFIVTEKGSVKLPERIKKMKIRMAGTVYRFGIGGIHSSEKCQGVRIDPTKERLVDKDVTSYYPSIILGQALFPSQLGRAFLTVYASIVERRIEAKHAGNGTVADSLKIVINGSFGKFGSPYSILYAPQLLIQTTITGQLSLLLLAESLELQGINIISANTDGIIIRCPLEKNDILETLCQQWTERTTFKLEDTEYEAVYSRDVNNYIALKRDYKRMLAEGVPVKKVCKAKGVFAPMNLRKTPSNQVVSNAVVNYLLHGKPVEDTINEATDPLLFATVRKVKGGAVIMNDDGRSGEYLGKAVRFYHSTDGRPMVYALSGNSVPTAEKVHSMMLRPDGLPENLDRDWYIKDAEKFLKLVGAA